MPVVYPAQKLSLTSCRFEVTVEIGEAIMIDELLLPPRMTQFGEAMRHFCKRLESDMDRHIPVRVVNRRNRHRSRRPVHRR